jgi:hypothetical protein
MDRGDVNPTRGGEPLEYVRNLRVPCGALSFDAAGAGPGEPEPESDGSYWRAKRLYEPVVFRAEPRATAYSIVLDGSKVRQGDPIVLERVKTEGAWTQVLRRGEAATILGWVLTAELVRLKRWPDEGYCCEYDDGYGLWGEHCQGCSPPTYEGVAEIPVGTFIYHGDSTPWAVVYGPGVFRVRQRANQDWATVMDVPGLVGPGGSGVSGSVPTSSVLFPPGAGPQ